jgi:RNA polymerase sigma factor (sigma-70 family)
MPTERPQFLSAFLCRITKNLAWKRIDYNRAQKRSPEVLLSLEELGECVSGESSPEQQIEAKWLGKQISDFLWSCKQEERVIFLRRYWYFDSIAEIARQLQISESKVKSVLYRMRKRLQNYLRAEGAAGETQAELLKLLAVSDIKELSGQCGSLYSQLYENESDSQFRIANSLWIAARQSNGRKIHWQKDYLNTLVKDFYASLFLVDFQEANTYQYMTEWVSDQTGGLLTPDFNPAQQEIPQL